MLTVYSKSNCDQCTATKNLLEKEGIPFELRDVAADGDAMLVIKELGYLQVPAVVTALGDHWSGFRPVKIKTHSAVE